MAIRPSTQQTIDRIVGTAVILGLSVAALRWLSQASKDGRTRQLPWWWPVLALRRRTKPARSLEDSELELAEARGKNMESRYEHRGSCHCGSVQFMLRGPQNLRTIDSPGKIRYPHIPTTAVQFHLLRGETDMKFYYVDDKTDTSIAGSTIASEEPDYNFENDNDQHNNRTQQQSAGAHGFCGNCGVHILRAPSRSSEDLEINANCLEAGNASPARTAKDAALLQRSSTSSLTSGGEVIINTPKDEGRIRSNPIETVNENEQLLGGYANFWESLDDRPAPPEPYAPNDIIPTETKERSDSIQNSQPLTQSVTESDDYSMGSSSLTATSSLHMLSVASGHVGVTAHNNRARLPPLPPSSGMSAKTLPPRFNQNQRSGYGGGRSVGAGLSSNWSIASMESNDLIDAEADKANTVTPKMMNQMKYYMGRHMSKEKRESNK